MILDASHSHTTSLHRKRLPTSWVPERVQETWRSRSRRSSVCLCKPPCSPPCLHTSKGSNGDRNIYLSRHIQCRCLSEAVLSGKGRAGTASSPVIQPAVLQVYDHKALSAIIRQLQGALTGLVNICHQQQGGTQQAPSIQPGDKQQAGKVFSSGTMYIQAHKPP